jgi:hypothetical protein
MGKNMHLQIESQRLKQFYEWVRETFTPSYQSEVEDYLAQSTDLADLERRMNTLARRGMV